MAEKQLKVPKVFNMSADQCVWAKTGVIGPTACINAFNCLDCPVDRKMQNRVKHRRLAQGPGRGMSPELKETLHRTSNDRRCRHMLSGRVANKSCPYDFDCTSCNFQQMMEDEALNAGSQPGSVESVAGFEMVKEYYFHSCHVWARVEYGGRVRIGLDDFAIRLLGNLDRIDLPDLGKRINTDTTSIVVYRKHLRLNLLTPLKGVVVAVNPAVRENRGVISQSPYGDGWLMVIEPLRLQKDLKQLFFGNKGLEWMEEESSRLAAMVSNSSGYKMAATGGRALPDILSRLPEDSWERVAAAFLQPAQESTAIAAKR